MFIDDSRKNDSNMLNKCRKIIRNQKVSFLLFYGYK